MQTMTVAQACTALHISRWTLARRLADGDLVATEGAQARRNVPRLHIDVDSIRAYAAAHTQLGQSTTGARPMSSDTLPRFHTLPEVAEKVGIPLKTLQRGCRTGKFTHILIPHETSDGAVRGGSRFMTDEQIRELAEYLTAARGVAPAAVDPEAETKARFARDLARKAAAPQRRNIRGAA